MTAVPASQNATLQVRPAPRRSSGSFPLTQEPLPKREAPWREKGVPPTSAPTTSRSPSSKTATTHPSSPATAHAAVASGADMTRRCMLSRPGFPSSPAPGSSPPRCHLRPGSTAPAAAGKRTESRGDRYRAEGLRRGRVAGARVWGRTANARSSAPAILRELRPWRPEPCKPLSRLHAGASGSLSFLFCSWDAVLCLVSTEATEIPP